MDDKKALMKGALFDTTPVEDSTTITVELDDHDDHPAAAESDVEVQPLPPVQPVKAADKSMRMW